MNPITGEGKVKIAGQEYTIRFDWSCLAEIETAHGSDPNLFNPDVVASVAAIGLKKYHPEMTAEKIKEASPPLVPFAQEVQLAMKYAYFGNDPIPEGDKTEKKSNQGRGGLWQRIKQRLGMVSVQ